MKLSETWLREWANPALATDELCQKLALCGLEVESLVPVAEKFSGVVIAQVISVEKHPEADRLHICQVNIGSDEILTIVCGATNVRPGMKVPAALVGAVLPNNVKISRGKLRGVVSNGMLCSGRELTLAEEANGIFEFPADAPIGQDAWDYLKLSDQIMDISITPNRGDCLSILGMAREIASITACDLNISVIPAIDSAVSDTLPVVVQAVAECPRYVGRVIKKVKADAITPIWLTERLRRSGIRCISPIVDVMNYVMLEMGQPMHAFDLQKITGGIEVRWAKSAEELELLDGQVIQLSPDTLVIADAKQPLAIAGVMGGLDSGVTSQTQTIFLESAFFQSHCIARTRQKYNLSSESSYRFERGIHPVLQVQAIERATALLLDIVGGHAGPIIEVVQKNQLPQDAVISLRAARVHHILGFKIEDAMIEMLLQRQTFLCEKNATGWQVTVPAYRFDISLEIDLIEEVIRLYGYDKLPLHHTVASLQMNTRVENKVDVALLRQSFCDAGYHEVITYSFVSQKYQQLFDPLCAPKVLANPITVEMSVMRTNLWPGLMEVLLHNQNRQQPRVRLFETGLRFVPSSEKADSFVQQQVVSGLVSGTALPEQWGVASRAVDFFDLKGDIENCLGQILSPHALRFKPSQHPALHPGQTAEIQCAGRTVGILGALHPAIAQTLDISGNVLLFELLLDELVPVSTPTAVELSKFPEIRRDIAIYVDQTVPSQLIQDTIENVGGELLKEINVFDVYQGKGVPADRKSIALALTLQHSSRTLLDEEVADVMGRVISALKQRFAAELRG